MLKGSGHLPERQSWRCNQPLLVSRDRLLIEYAEDDTMTKPPSSSMPFPPRQITWATEVRCFKRVSRYEITLRSQVLILLPRIAKRMRHYSHLPRRQWRWCLPPHWQPPGAHAPPPRTPAARGPTLDPSWGPLQTGIPIVNNHSESATLPSTSPRESVSGYYY